MDALAALSLQIAWGADEALDELPVDRTRSAAAPLLAALPPGRVAAIAPAAGPGAKAGSAARAQALATSCSTIDELRASIASFTECPLAATATTLVFADGNPSSGLVFVGDVPGAAEDSTGIPFKGAAGQLLNRMLASIGLDRTQALLTNLIPWRPPGNRAATEAELQMCLPFLQRHLVLLQPRIVVTLGALATHALTGTDISLRRLRGKWRTLDSARLLPMCHPEYLIQAPAAKREAWHDLMMLRRALDETK